MVKRSKRKTVFTFVSVRNLFKLSEVQNKSEGNELLFCISETQRTLLKRYCKISVKRKILVKNRVLDIPHRLTLRVELDMLCR